MKSKLLTLFLVLITIQLHSQALTKEEKQVVDYISNNMRQTIDLLKEMVNINSVV